jgi:tRNA pseudouridine38-40 synthase
VVQYLGTHFYGWQRQPHHRSVQGDIEAAIAATLGQPVNLHGAGRTDTGVHAAAQVAHFDASGPIPPQRWAPVLNTQLPEDVRILASAPVADDWHARFSATWRRYRYVLYTDAKPSLFLRPYTWHYYHDVLDADLMQAALTPLVGRHHLAAFHRAGSGRSHSWVNVQVAQCQRHGEIIEIELQSSGFLYGMIRLLVGLLVQVGRRWITPDAFTEIWQSQRRDLVKYAAPARGLCLTAIGYPETPFPASVWSDVLPNFYVPTRP